MKRSAIILFLSLSAVSVAPQTEPGAQPEKYGIKLLTDYLGLRAGDISFRGDYTEPDSFRLAIVTDLMSKPLGMIDYLSELRGAYVPNQPEILAAILFQDMAKESQAGRRGAYRPTSAQLQQPHNLYYTDLDLNQLLQKVALYIDLILPRSVDKAFAGLSRSQRKFLYNEFKELIVTHEYEEFLSIEAIDSLAKVEEVYCDSFVAFGYKIDKDPIVAAGIDLLREISGDINRIRQRLSSGQVTGYELLEAATIIPDNVDKSSYLGQQPGWRIGGPGNDYYSGDYSFILDLGGDDVYDLEYDPANPHGVLIIDLGGDDRYRSSSDFTLGSGCFSAGILLDFAGNDRYDARSFSIASGYFGFGLLYDAAGDDHYSGDTHVQGAGSFGLGLLIDAGGRDIYNGALHCQGFGFVEGIGLIYESEGSDSYLAGGKYKDILRYEDRYLSLSQGFGYGLRPWMSGGIGGIIDLTGNDTYRADIFGQGASYWWSLGMILDSSGNDNYHCFQYGQGAATHMTLGILLDENGHDTYSGKGLMQGVGHDYSCGILLDRNGNDTYVADDLSQAAGSANGIGLLIDGGGNDRYLIREPKNTHGYGNPRREFGSIGLLIDLGGDDQYTGMGGNNLFWRTASKWGGGMDLEQ